MGPSGAMVNSQLLQAYSSSTTSLASLLQSAVASNPDYTMTFTGHGTGGSLAALAATNYATQASKTVQLVTFGEPRLGNSVWANYTDSVFGTKSNPYYLRVTRVADEMIDLLSTSNGYAFSGKELSQVSDTGDASSITECSGSEDPACRANSNSFDSTQSSSSDTSQSSGSYSPQVAPITSVSSSNAQTQANTAPAYIDPAALITGPVMCSTCAGTACVGCIDDYAQPVDQSSNTMPSVNSMTMKKLSTGVHLYVLGKSASRKRDSLAYLGVSMDDGSQYCQSSTATSAGGSGPVTRVITSSAWSQSSVSETLLVFALGAVSFTFVFVM